MFVLCAGVALRVTASSPPHEVPVDAGIAVRVTTSLDWMVEEGVVDSFPSAAIVVAVVVKGTVAGESSQTTRPRRRRSGSTATGVVMCGAAACDCVCVVCNGKRSAGLSDTVGSQIVRPVLSSRVDEADMVELVGTSCSCRHTTPPA